MTFTEAVEDCVRWYWQGYDDFSRMDVPMCPFEDGRPNSQWWAGYDDAEIEYVNSLK